MGQGPSPVNQGGNMIREPIEHCSDEFMQQVRAQNEDNIPGIQLFRHRIWPKSEWQETESLTVGKPFYTKQIAKGDSIDSWKRPHEIKGNTDYIEEYRQYPWKNQVNFLKDDTVDYAAKYHKDMKSEPFKVITNTFPIKLSQDIDVLEYEIKAEGNEVQDDWGFYKNKNKIMEQEHIEKVFKQLNHSYSISVPDLQHILIYIC